MGSRRKDQHYEAHRVEAKVENIDFLLSSGLHVDLVAHRLGLSRDMLEKTMDRKVGFDWRQRYPGSFASTGEGT